MPEPVVATFYPLYRIGTDVTVTTRPKPPSEQGSQPVASGKATSGGADAGSTRFRGPPLAGGPACPDLEDEVSYGREGEVWAVAENGVASTGKTHQAGGLRRQSAD
jgi:hypothetical protein